MNRGTAIELDQGCFSESVMAHDFWCKQFDRSHPDTKVRIRTPLYR
jgi:hypothetical protein